MMIKMKRGCPSWKKYFCWRFYRGREHASEEGVGIGLYLVRQIAEGQGGYVKVSSQPGKGSTFSLYLPRK